MNSKHFAIKPIVTIFLISLFSLTLNGCGNDKSNSTPTQTVQKKVQKYKKQTVLKGIVSNKKGIINSGEIKATDSKGKEVASTELSGNSHYTIIIPKDTQLPITLTLYPSKDSADKEILVSIAIHAAIKTYDINDLTTAIAKKAKALGGYTHSNMVMAADSTVGVPDANKTSTGFRGDPTKQYGGWH